MFGLKRILTDIKIALGAGDDITTDNIYAQYPESTTDMYLAAGATYSRETSMNRKLEEICLSVPSGVVMTIYNDNNVWMWKTDEAGTFTFKAGITFGTMRIEVVNNNTDVARWTCNMSYK